MRALSVRQPWAHAIIHLGKPVENRGRVHSYRGPLLIHASAGMTAEEWEEASAFIGAKVGIGLPPRSRVERGGIIGIVDMIDAVKEHPSPWWMGPAAFVLANPRPLPFIPCRGTVTPLIWEPDAETVAQVRSALRA